MAEYGEWTRKGATLSDVTARKVYGVSYDFIVKGYVPAVLPAMVVRKRGANVTAADIKARCLEDVPKYAHPRFVEIVGEKEVPLNGAGKIDCGIARKQIGARASGRVAAC